LLRRLKVDEHVNKKHEGTPIKVEAVITKLVYYILLIYVALISLNLLKVKDALDPLKIAMTDIFAAIPNVISAVFIGFLGYVIAKVVSSIVLAATAGLDPVAPKAGLSKKLSISKTLERISFIMIFVPILIQALDTLKITAISDPAKHLLQKLLDAVPGILGAAVILILFYIVGRFIADFLSGFLAGLGADEIPKKIGASGIFGKKSFSKFCSGLVFFFIMLSAAVFAVDILKVPRFSEILAKLIQFSGNVVIGLIVLAIGNFIATYAADAIAKSTKNAIVPLVVRIAILALVIAMGLHTMGIGKEIVDMAFFFALATASLTVIIAFGIGGIKPAGALMEDWLNKLKTKK
jgi:hypothetical protein